MKSVNNHYSSFSMEKFAEELKRQPKTFDSDICFPVSSGSELNEEIAAT
jgi:hypothetical protein